MSRIDASRIASVFRLLSTGKSGPAAIKDPGSQSTSAATTNVVTNSKRDPEVLRQRLRQRLMRLKQDNADFLSLAPEITIREVLIWEFGDTVLSHPDFNQVANSVSSSMQANSEVRHQLQALIVQMTAE